MPKLILSAVGTSLFTNRSGDNRSKINKGANLSADKIPHEVAELIEGYKEEILSIFKNGSLTDLKKASAELNSILSFYNNRLGGNDQDMHVLIATDTFMGKESATLIKEYLNNYFV